MLSVFVLALGCTWDVHRQERALCVSSGVCVEAGTTVGFACVLPYEIQGSTQVVRLGGKRCYLLSHTAGPSLILLRHFINPQHDLVCLFIVD